MLAFILNNDTIQTDMPPGMTVLDFVRYHHHLKGTKIGCREGDCGACTVIVGDIKGNEVHYQTMTSCLMPLQNAAGKHIVTVEGINPADGSLTPVQQSMVDHHGIQCGFCTVGFVMSLTSFGLEEGDHTPEAAISSIDGNICRCTGYKSIERAAHQISSILQSENGIRPVAYCMERGIVPAWFHTIPERLKALKAAPVHTNALSSRLVMNGGTDLYVQRPEDMVHAPAAYVFDDPVFNQIKNENGRIDIGGSVTVTDLLESDVMRTYFPNLYPHMKLVSSTPIRNMATVAGNLINASPIGDLTIWFLAMNATVVLRNGQTREIPLRDFYYGYKTMEKTADEIVEKIYFRTPDPYTWFNFEKVSKRRYLDIASVNSAISMTVKNQIVTDAHVSVGGVSPIPLYLKNTSSCLLQKRLPLEEEDKKELHHLLQAEIHPISDVRGSAAYKRTLAHQLFNAHFVEYHGRDQ